MCVAEKEKVKDEPICTGVTVRLVGEDGNVFAIIGRVSEAIRRSRLPNRHQLAKQFVEEATSQKSYDDVLILCMKYVDVE